MIVLSAIMAVLLVLAVVFMLGLRARDIHIWFISSLKHMLRVRRIKELSGDKPIHVVFCFVDHYEPYCGGVTSELAGQRVRRWLTEYPAIAMKYSDADGHYPQHSFFYPEEEYEANLLAEICELCRRGFGEVEVHLHHDNDTDAGLKRKLSQFVGVLRSEHGLLTEEAGQLKYAFIHGNWALDNSRCDGRWCGVNNELQILRDTGCYADFTLPSAPSDTQTTTINSIYYATDDPHRPKSHDHGIPVQVGKEACGDLLIFQGPLALNWKRRKFGLWPRIENGDIAVCDIPIEERVDMWIRQHIHVLGRPEWLFVKVHTHGAIEENADWLLGGEMDRLFSYLQARYNDGHTFVLHYATAREAYNMVKAAEAGKSGNPNDFRDFRLHRPPYGLNTEIDRAT